MDDVFRQLFALGKNMQGCDQGSVHNQKNKQKSNRMRCWFFQTLFLNCVLISGLQASEVENFQWQHSLQVAEHPEKGPVNATAYLWVPPESQHIRGVLLGGRVLMESDLVRDPSIRQVCRDHDLAIVFFNPHVDVKFNYEQPVPEQQRLAPEVYLQQMLDGLAQKSGYGEIAHVPLMTFGHSVGTLFAQRVGYWNPDRVAGIILLKGGLGSPPEHDPEGHLDGVPLLHVQGQFEEFGPQGPLQEGEDRTAGFFACIEGFTQRRQDNPDQQMMGVFIEPGGTHFAWSPRIASVVAPWIAAVAELRLPQSDNSSDNAPQNLVKPLPITADQGAYLAADFISIYQTGAALPPPVAADAVTSDGNMAGTKTEMFWYPSLEVAERIATIIPDLGKQGQYVSAQSPKYPKQKKRKKGEPAPENTTYPEIIDWLNPARAGHDNRVYIKPHIRHDWTFELRGAFLDAIPKTYPDAGQAATHSETVPPQLRVFGGNVRQLDETTFQLHGDMRFGDRVAILAYHPGDETYRYAAQSILYKTKRLFRGKRAGNPQSLTFDLGVTSVTYGDPLPALNATAESGLPVSYYVDSGPARINEAGELN